VLLIDLPRVLGDIVRETLMSDPHIRVAPIRSPDDCRGASGAAEARRERPDTVILGTDLRELDPEWDVVFSECPWMKVLTVVGSGRESFLYELRPTRIPLGELSPEKLLDAVRAARPVAR
jgi:hypothetical protein